jgi:Uncharacterized protein conserved in bacteria
MEVDPTAPRPCPRCGDETKAVVIGATCLRECPKCEGLWVDAESLEQIYKDRERQVAFLGTAVDLPLSPDSKIEVVRYLRCPVCRALMNRVQFAKCSHVIVDVCKAHGTWFDKDELRRIVEFIRAGGLDEARAREIKELERKRREFELARSAASSGGYLNEHPSGGHTFSAWDIAASVAAGIFDSWN